VQRRYIDAVFPFVPTLVFHNSPFDVPSLVRNHLMSVEHVNKVEDTLIYARLADPDERSPKSLEKAADKYLGGEHHDNELLAAFKRLGLTKAEGFYRFDLDRPMYAQGAAIDAIVTARLLPRVKLAALSRLTTGHPYTANGVTGDEAKRLAFREQRINRILLSRSCRGLHVDLDYLEEYRERTTAHAESIAVELKGLGITPGNGNHLTSWLEKNGHLPKDYPRTEKTKRPSATARHLEGIKHPIAAKFVEWKRISKVEGDYLSKVAELSTLSGGTLIHPTVNILAATTGRMSMGDPPLHQFSAPARGIIVPDPGDSFSSIDWSQIEPVIMANVAGELGVLEPYEAGTGDLYTTIASWAKVTRKEAKVILLAQLYGEGVSKLARDLGIPEFDAQQLRMRIMGAVPNMQRLMWRLRDLGERYQKVFTLSGRILGIPMGRGFDGGPPSIATHKAINYFVQGSAYDVLAEAIISLDEAGLSPYVYLTMHDELIVSTSVAEEVQRIMQTPPPRLITLAKRTPILRTDRADLGERWAAA
jgi:DNA polymerase-1